MFIWISFFSDLIHIISWLHFLPRSHQRIYHFSPITYLCLLNGTWPRCTLKVVTNSWVFRHFPIWRIFLVSPAAKPAGNPSEAIFSLVSWKNNSEVPYISSQCPPPQQNGAPTAYRLNNFIHTPWFTCLPFFPVLFLYSFLLLPRWPPRESICMQIIASKSFFKKFIILGGGAQMKTVIQKLPSLFVWNIQKRQTCRNRK